MFFSEACQALPTALLQAKKHDAHADADAQNCTELQCMDRQQIRRPWLDTRPIHRRLPPISRGDLDRLMSHRHALALLALLRIVRLRCHHRRRSHNLAAVICGAESPPLRPRVRPLRLRQESLRVGWQRRREALAGVARRRAASTPERQKRLALASDCGRVRTCGRKQDCQLPVASTSSHRSDGHFLPRRMLQAKVSWEQYFGTGRHVAALA